MDSKEKRELQKMLAEKDRTSRRLRKKQDKLLKLCKGFDRNLRLSSEYPGSPTIGNLETMVWPDWESLIDAKTYELEKSSKDFYKAMREV